MIMKTAKAKGNKAVRLFNGSRDPGMATVGEGGVVSRHSDYTLCIVGASFFVLFLAILPFCLTSLVQLIFSFFSIPLASGLDF
jgi:hypothetical protein